MGELRREFLKQTISNLETLQSESSDNLSESLSDNYLRRFFRTLHTIKGTSNTFNLSVLAQIAHELENLLQAVQDHQIVQNHLTKKAFQDGFSQLLLAAVNYQKGIEVSLPTDFIEDLRNLIPEKDNSNDLSVFKIPNRILAKLSTTETDVLSLAIQKGRFFYLLKVTFPLSSFYADFKIFKELLNDNGEVIAIASAPNKNPQMEIIFQVYFVTNLVKTEVEAIIQNFSVQIEFESIPSNQDFPDNLSEVLENLVRYGKKTAQFLNKTINFETDFSEVKFSNTQLILLNEVASHLLHNAIDHAIEPAEERVIIGKSPVANIKIKLGKIDNEIIFEIQDDGIGIDTKKVLSIAKERGLLKDDESSDENEAIQLIFSQGFSTSEKISEISGRGVGLDAVKDLVEKSNGRIEVKTKEGFGSTFSVYLPQV